METLPIELELRKLGLKEKEVKVYLAGLELGPSSAQEIAKTTNIARPTVYETIKSLERNGLFEEIKKAKKRYFVAQSPDNILGMLKIKKREIEEKEREFIRIIAALESKYSKDNNAIKTYNGEEGIKVLYENLLFTPLSKIFILTDGARSKEREEIYRKIKKRLGKIEIKEISNKKTKTPFASRKLSSQINLKGTLILSDKAIFINQNKEQGFLIENPLLVNLLKSLFSAFWKLI